MDQPNNMSKWGSVGCVPENTYLPPTSVRVIVLITIIFALIATVFAVVVLTRHGYPVAAALSAGVATIMLSEGAMYRLTWWQHPSSA
jgi:hypothetical protein